MKCIVTGGGGFLGHNMVKRLKRDGHWVRAVDIKPKPDFEDSIADEYLQIDLRKPSPALIALGNGSLSVDRLFCFAADMGGMGYLDTHSASVLVNNGQINENTLQVAQQVGVGRVFFSSSACVYPEHLQNETMRPLTENDAYPANPDLAYGWEKLYNELRCRYYKEQYGLDSRIARFHNVFGPLGQYEGGKEKAPAAACRKVAIAKLGEHRDVEIWGDGLAVRSFLYIDDALDGILALMESDYIHPVNIGSDESITIKGLFELTASIAATKIDLVHVDGPQGVRARNSDNTLCKKVLGWEPRVSLEEGMRRTYEWIESRIAAGCEKA